MTAIENLLLDALHYLGIGEEAMHLMNSAILTVAFVFLIMMLGVFIVHIAILLALFLYHTDTTHVVMMSHHRGKQHAQRCYPKAEDIKSSFIHEIEKLICNARTYILHFRLQSYDISAQ